jgi:membrane protein
LKYKKILLFIKKLYFKILHDEIPALGAQVAYYLILSFFPFLVFLVTIVSYTKIVTPDSLNLISGFLPHSVFELINDIVQNVIKSRNTAFISLGMLATVWSASAGVLAFMYGMNKAYKKKETRPFWQVRALSILFTLGLSVIIIFSIVLVVFGELLGNHLSYILHLAGMSNIMWDIFRYAISLITLLIVFILFYLYIPNCKLPVKSVLPGAMLSTIGWIALSAGFSFYINNFSNLSKIYGSIGAAIALLIWLYWSSIIVFVGSELNVLLFNTGKSTR